MTRNLSYVKSEDYRMQLFVESQNWPEELKANFKEMEEDHFFKDIHD